LRHQVDFWVDIFARYSERQVVIHDTIRLDRVYSVLDFRNLPQLGMNEVQIARHVQRTVAEKKKSIQAVLRRLDKRGGRAVTAEERRIAALFQGSTSAHGFRRAAAEDRIRAQSGLRERFARGIEVGHRYFPEMERIFRDEQVPVEITRLPLVESTFNVQAYSRKGAAGIWQFIPATGRLFMRIDTVVDERRDPLISSHAAARFLRQNYEKLGTWPLAISAYNHGPLGITRAVRATGTTDISTIVENYKGPAFKFASRNFYTEFLAALEVERNHARYFGPLNLEAPVPFDVVRPAHFVSLDSMARCAGVSADTIVQMNPSLSYEVRRGKLRIPRDYPIRVPAGSQEGFASRYAAMPRAQKFAKQRQLYVVHRVRRGQTLGTIARQYGSSIEEIRRYNKIPNKHLIRTGQRLRIPTS